MENYKIDNDVLIRKELTCTSEGGFPYIKETVIITKDEFMACYNAWVKQD